MRPVIVVLAVFTALAGAACTDDGVGAGEAAISIEEGARVLVAERGDDLRLADGRRTLHLGAQVKVLAGSASIALENGGRLEVREGSEVAIGSPVSLVAEDLLVTSGNVPLKVAAAGSQFTVDGVARLSRDLAVSAATYRGSVTLSSAARSLTVPALREAAVASLGVLPTSPRPLDYDQTDPWDRRFLGQAIELGDQLEAKSTGFTESLDPGEGRTAGFYRVLLPALEAEREFNEDLLAPGLRPGEALVGATIALHSRQGSFAERWNAVFAFRSEGARWGLVALDQQVNDTSGLVQSVDAAIGRQSFAFAPVRVPTPPPPTVAPVTPPAPATTPAEPATLPRSPQPATPAAPATQPAAKEPPLLTVPTVPPLLQAPDPEAPKQGLLEPLVTVVTGTLDGLLNGR